MAQLTKIFFQRVIKISKKFWGGISPDLALIPFTEFKKQFASNLKDKKICTKDVWFINLSKMRSET